MHNADQSLSITYAFLLVLVDLTIRLLGQSMLEGTTELIQFMRTPRDAHAFYSEAYRDGSQSHSPLPSTSGPRSIALDSLDSLDS